MPERGRLSRASQLKYDNTGSGLTATNVQGAIDEVSVGGDPSVSKTLTYNMDDTLNVITTDMGTKTMGYNPDGTLATVTGTGIYKTKAFTYAGGVLTVVTVS